MSKKLYSTPFLPPPTTNLEEKAIWFKKKLPKAFYPTIKHARQTMR